MILKWIRRKQIVIILICLIIICVSLPVMLYANANLPELVQRNLNDSLILVVELQELGYDFIGAKEDHAYILQKYLGHMKKRNFSLLLRVLYPDLSPRKQLTYALADLNLKEKVTKQDQAKGEIEKAEKTIRQFFSKSQKFFGTQILILEHEDLPEGLLSDAKSALDDSEKYVEIYMVDPNITTAQEACRKNRVAVTMAYLVRCAYQHSNSLEDELKQFRGDINRTIYYNDVLQEKKETSEEHKNLLEKYTRSEIRRLEIVDAILDKDNHRAYKLLRETIEISS